MIENINSSDGDDEVWLPGVVPKMSATPGGTKWVGPKLGENTPQKCFANRIYASWSKMASGLAA